MFIDRWMDKEIVHRYSVVKKKWNNVICSYVDSPKDYHTKWSKSEEGRQIPYDITFMWNQKYDTNEFIYKTETDSQTENRLLVVKGDGKGWWLSWELEDTNYFIYIK